MNKQLTLNDFDYIYNKTYNDVLKFIIIKCQNINDANDILQDTYLEFYNILKRKNINDNNIKSFLLSIANNKIKKYYNFFYKLKTISLFNKDKNDIELIETLKEDINIENLVIKDDDWHKVWKFLKSRKNQNIPKIFYLYYYEDMKIKDIANSLNISSSNVKNYLYRTLKELNTIFRKDND